MGAELTDVFLRDKPAKILVGIRRGQDRKYASVLSKEADCTYSHTKKVLDRFEDDGLIRFDEEGRKKLIELTDRGRQLARTMDRLMTQLDDLGRGR